MPLWRSFSVGLRLGLGAERGEPRSYAGATLFYSSMADVMLEPRALEGNQLASKVAACDPLAGRMILCRSPLRHSVMPGDFDGERVSAACNAIV